MSARSQGRSAWSTGNSKNPAIPQEEKLEFDNQNNVKKGCWHSFSGCIGGMWATRQMNKGEDREIYVRTTLRELFIYLLFLVIVVILTFGMVSPTMYYYTRVLSDLFTDAPYPDTKNNFKGSTQVLDFWRFAETVMLDGLYWEYWYDLKKSPTSGQDRNILYENKQLGAARLRQIRVGNKSCIVPENFQKAIRQCYGPYSSANEDTTTFGLNTAPTWSYNTADKTGSGSHWGKLAVYSGAGSYIDLKLLRNETTKQIADLRSNLWIGRGTRAVFLDFTVYNANINLFCVVKLLFEFPPTGGMVTSSSFLTVKLLRYVTPTDYFVLACECIFIFYILYYIVEESLEIKQLKMKYFKSMWNILDIIVIVLSLICIGFSAYCSLTVSGKLEELLGDPTKFANFESLGYWQMQYNSAVAICVFFAVFKLFKYISFNKTMTQLSSTISRCSKDLAGFAIMFFIVFFAFAQLGYLLFGTQVQDFNHFVNAGFTLLRTILGDFNFHEIEEANRVLGPLFFLSYVFFVFFVLLNMFLAIINDTYSEVKAEIANQKNEFEIGDYFKRGYNNLLEKMGRRDRYIDIQNALRLSDTNNDGVYTFDEVRTNLKRIHLTDMEIEMIFAHFDTDSNQVITNDELKVLLHDLKEQQGQQGAPDIQKTAPADTAAAVTEGSTEKNDDDVCRVNYEEFSVLQRRVDRLEHSIGSIVSKIDAVLVKLDSMEKSKSKRKDTMSKILDTITEDDSLDDPTKRKQMENLVRNELNEWDKS